MTNSILRRLRALREKSNHRQHKHSAIIMLRGRPLSFGFNNPNKTHPFIRKYSPVKAMHSEVAALLACKNKSLLKKAVMIVYREARDGTMANSRPCSVCMAILKDSGLKTIMFSTPNGWVEERL